MGWPNNYAEYTYDSNGNVVGLANGSGLIPQLQLVQLQLKKWRAALANTQLGVSNSKILFIGDSTTVGTSASGAFSANNRPLAVSDALARLLLNNGINVNVASQIGAANITPAATFATYDTRWTLGAGWSIGALGNAGGNCLQNTTDVTAANFTPKNALGEALQFDTIEVIYLKNASYTPFTIAVDGGAAISTATQTGSGEISTLSATTTLGTHTVNIAKTGAGGTTYITGITCYNSATKAVFCYNVGGNSQTAAMIGSTVSYFSSLNGISYMAPNLSIINCTINDIAAVTNIATYTEKMQSIITACLATGSVILYTANPTKIGVNGYAIGNEIPYINALYSLSATNNIPIVDTFSRLVSWTDANTYGYMVDSVHPNKVGYQDIANALIDFVKPKY